MKTQIFSVLFALWLLHSSSQAATITQHQVLASKIDILFVIDNSGSMAASIENLIQHMPKVIEHWKNASIDYRIGVTTTEAYIANYFNRPEYKRLRDGHKDTHSGVFVITPDTPDLVQVLSINLNQGTQGSGDERAFSSFRDVLNYSGNNDFRRPDAALSVLLLSDEDDFSHNDRDRYYFTENYNDPNMIPVKEFADYLKSLGGQNLATFSTISILNNDCKSQMYDSAQKIGLRAMALADATRGFKGNLCELESTLEQYSQFVVDQARSQLPGAEYVIKLHQQPLLETIVVKVNGQWIPQDSQNGWTYEAATVSLILHGKAIPQQGDLASVSYDYEEYSKSRSRPGKQSFLLPHSPTLASQISQKF